MGMRRGGGGRERSTVVIADEAVGEARHGS